VDGALVGCWITVAGKWPLVVEPITAWRNEARWWVDSSWRTWSEVTILTLAIDDRSLLVADSKSKLLFCFVLFVLEKRTSYKLYSWFCQVHWPAAGSPREGWTWQNQKSRTPAVPYLVICWLTKARTLCFSFILPLQYTSVGPVHNAQVCYIPPLGPSHFPLRFSFTPSTPPPPSHFPLRFFTPSGVRGSYFLPVL